METAKVDIKKLQVLSDRINQCIDALNQVRLSVHGLAPLTPFTSGQQGFGGQAGFGQPGLGGLSHTSGSPFGALGNIGPFGNINPYANPYATPGAIGFSGGAYPGTVSPMTGLGLPGGIGQGIHPMQGLSHTGPESAEAFRSTWNDPYLAAKVSQTFPYLQFAVPPVVSLY